MQPRAVLPRLRLPIPKFVLRRLWEALRTSHWAKGPFWVAGVALGLIALRASLSLPASMAAALWPLPIALGLLPALRAEPLLWVLAAPRDQVP